MQNSNKEFADGYYDGIPEEIKKMTPEELDRFIEAETKKCEKLNQQ